MELFVATVNGCGLTQRTLSYDVTEVQYPCVVFSMFSKVLITNVYDNQRKILNS